MDERDDDFSDLEPLRRIIGNAQVVGLGEQSHTDGTTFAAKLRLIKFLHQRMGFGVLAFESGFFDCSRAWQSLKAGDDPLESARTCLFGTWTRAKQIRPLFSYLAQEASGDRPLVLAGFDCQLTGSASRDFLFKDLREVFRQAAPEFGDARVWDDVKMSIDKVRDWEHPPTIQERHRGMAALSRIASEFAFGEVGKRLAPDLAAFWGQTIQSVQALVEYEWREPRPLEGDLDIPANLNPRDEQMANNLLWLARSRFSDRKIIVWAATMHLVRNADTIDTVDGHISYRGVVPMGHILARELGRDYFSIGFLAHDGHNGPSTQPLEIGRAPRGSFEDLLVRAGVENGIIDLRDAKREGGLFNDKLIARPLGYLVQRADWSNVLDAMFFTKLMEPVVVLPPSN